MDQTNFWLGWRATCAAADCANSEQLRKACERTPGCEDVLKDVEGTTELARGVIGALNKTFAEEVNYCATQYERRRVSDCADEIAQWDSAHPERGCAFMLVEGYLYAKESIAGRPFKDYLFEDIATRDGGVCKNLCGYIQLVARTCARRSFGKMDLVEELIGDDGESMGPKEGVTEDRGDWYSISPREGTDVQQVADFFCNYLGEMESKSKWDTDHWVVLFCAFYAIPYTSSEVLALCRRKKTALGEIHGRLINDLLGKMRSCGFTHRAIAYAMENRWAAILDDKMKGLPCFGELERIREENEKKKADTPENAG